MSVIEKLKEAVRSVVQERQDLYAEARLNDGRVIATEAEQFSAGASVRVLSEDGEAAPLEAGTYDLSDGGQVSVDAESNVVEMMDEKEEEKTEAAEQEEDKDEMAAVKAALIEQFQISEEVASQIMDVIKDAMKPVEAEEEKKEEEMEEEDKKKEEMSSHVQDLTHEMAIALEAINTRLEKLEEAPAAQPDRVLPKQEFNAVPKASNARGASVDNALNIINSFK